MNSNDSIIENKPFKGLLSFINSTALKKYYEIGFNMFFKRFKRLLSNQQMLIITILQD